MSLCNEHDFDILRYLDNELSGGERDKLRSHLKGCADCRALLQKEQELSRLLSRSRPLYTAPTTLRARVSAEISQHAEQSREPIRFYEAAPPVVWPMLRSVRSRGKPSRLHQGSARWHLACREADPVE